MAHRALQYCGTWLFVTVMGALIFSVSGMALADSVYTLTATSSDETKGTVAVDKGSAASGEEFAASANAAAGYAFAFWKGDLPESYKHLNPLSLPADASYAIQAVFGKAAEVPSGGNVRAAIEQVGADATADCPGVVVLAPGDYAPGEDDAGDYAFEISQNVIVKATGASPAETVLNASQKRGVKLAAGSRIENLTLTNCTAVGTAGYAFGILAQDADVIDCVLKGGAGIRYVSPGDHPECYVEQHGGLFRNFTIDGAYNWCPWSLSDGARAENVCVSNCNRSASGGTVGLMPCGMSIKGEGTVVSNLVYCNNTLSKGWDHSGFGIYLSGGAELVDSVVCSNKIDLTNSYNGQLPMVQIAGGTMRRTKVVYTASGSQKGDPGFGIFPGVYITDGLVENCLIAGNTIAKAGETQVVRGTRRAAGVYLGGGTLANTTVAGNCSCLENDVHGVSMSGGTIVNSIIAGNGYSEGSAQVAKVANGTDNVLLQSLTAIDAGITYTLVGDAGVLNPAGDGVVVGEAYFVDAANGDYRLRLCSVGIDAGSSEAVASAIDLAGENRIIDAAVDLGAYETVSAERVEIADRQTLFKAGSSVTVVAAAGVHPQAGAKWQWSLQRNGNLVESGEIASDGAKTVRIGPLQMNEPGRYEMSVTIVLPSGTAAGDTFAYSVLGNIAYVSADGSNVWPYDSWETAAHSLGAAIDCIGNLGTAEEKAKIFVAPGDYAPGEGDAGDYAFEIPQNVIVKATGSSPAETVLDASKKRGMKLAAGSRIENLTLTNCTAVGTAGYAFGILAQDADVIDCVLKGGAGISYSSDGDHPEYYVEQHGGLFRNFAIDGACNWCPWRLSDGARAENVCVRNCNRNAAGGAVGLMPYGMSIKGEGTVVSNLVYCNNTLRKGWDHSGFGIYLSGSAELVDSVVCNNKIELHNSYNGILPVVQIAGGMMRRTRVVCNYSDVRPWNPNTGAYSGVYITSGLAENCLIASNTLAKAEESHVNNGTRRAAGVYLGGGTLANTTVAGNSSCLAGDVHGVSMSGGTIVNSIIAGNGESEGSAQVAKVANGTDNALLQSLTAIDTGVTYTLVGDAGALNPAGEGVLIGDPCFRNASNGDYHPTGASPARRAGSISETVSLDLDGAARPAGKRSDLGCYVVDSKGMLIILR